jgi:hypothetical protein
LPRDVDGGRADEAVPADEVVIQKRQRFVGRQRRKPEREAGQLHGRWIQVDTEETSLSDQAPELRAVHFIDTCFVGQAFANQRTLVRARQIPACGDEKGSTAHRWIHNAKLKNSIGRSVVD